MKQAKIPHNLHCCLIYSTASDEDEALRIGRTLVEERLAACINVLPGMISAFRWKNAVETDREAVLILKTTQNRADACIRRLTALHPYETPCAVTIPIQGGLPDTLRWIADSVAE